MKYLYTKIVEFPTRRGSCLLCGNRALIHRMQRNVIHQLGTVVPVSKKYIYEWREGQDNGGLRLHLRVWAARDEKKGTRSNAAQEGAANCSLKKDACAHTCDAFRVSSQPTRGGLFSGIACIAKQERTLPAKNNTSGPLRLAEGAAYRAKKPRAGTMRIAVADPSTRARNGRD